MKKFFSRFLRHRHQWTPISAQLVRYHEGFLDMQPLHTVILKRCCKCGEHASFVVMGDWSLSTLMLVDSELSVLERMGR